MQLLRLLPLAHHAVPLINQKDKLSVCFRINLFKHSGKACFLFRKKFPIYLADIGNDHLFQVFCHFLFFCPDKKLLHVQVNNIILIQMFLKCLITLYLVS